MQIDLSTLSGDPYDLIIVGSGPACLTLARKYDEFTTGKTLIVKSGHCLNLDSDTQKLNVIDASGDLPVTAVLDTISEYLMARLRFGVATARYWKNVRS